MPNEYRMTRNTPYLNTDQRAAWDLSKREPYYILANSESEAIQIMKDLFADDTLGFTGWLWRKNVTEETATGRET